MSDGGPPPVPVPAPAPVPADADLRPLPYMPLDVKRLRDSDLAATATGEEFRAAILLWCAAWHQIPAASLPDDDRVLAMLAGYGRDVAGWQEVRAVAMDGFARAADGRLYHPVVVEKAVVALAARQGMAARREGDRTRKRRTSADDAPVDAAADDTPAPSDEIPPEFPAVSDGIPAEFRGDKREGTEGKGEDGSAGDAADDAAASLRPRLFGPIADWMVEHGGRSAAQARSFLGRACRDHGDAATLAACLEAQQRGAPDPLAYVHAILKGKDHGRRSRRRDGAVDPDYRADMLAGIGLGAG